MGGGKWETYIAAISWTLSPFLNKMLQKWVFLLIQMPQSAAALACLFIFLLMCFCLSKQALNVHFN